MLNDPIMRKSIYASLIASLLVIIFIQPILGATGKLFVWAGTNIYSGLSNTIYKDAALGLREKYSFILVMALFAFCIGINVAFIRIRYFRKDEVAESAKPESKFGKYFSLIIIVLLLISVLFLSSTEFASFQMNASFKQRLTVLAPKLTDLEVKELGSAWASMKTRADYDTINAKMENIAQTNRITLPKVLW